MHDAPIESSYQGEQPDESLIVNELAGLSLQVDVSLDAKIAQIRDKEYRNLIAIEFSKINPDLLKGGMAKITKVINGRQGTTIELEIQSRNGRTISFKLTGKDRNSTFSLSAEQLEGQKKQEIDLIRTNVEHGFVFGSIYGSNPDGSPSVPIHGLFVRYLKEFLAGEYKLRPRR